LTFAPALIITAAIGLACVWGIFLYNGLVQSRNRTQEAWSGISVQLKRRSSLIPNLVETVRGYATHEDKVFNEVSRARGALAQASGPGAAAAADQMLSSALGRLMAVAEAYPQLQAVTVFKQLQANLTDTEEKIAYARQFYNVNVLSYNTAIQKFPANILAGWMRFEAVEFFKAEEAAEQEFHVNFTAA
jgi:LemA protein